MVTPDPASEQPSDAALVQAVFARDPLAYDRLVDRHVKAVFGVTYRLLGNAADAEDATQDTFVRAYERLYLFDPQGSLRNWLLKMAANLALNKLRSRRRERILHLRLAAEPKPESAPEPSRAPASGDLDARWQYWLDQLDEMQRTAIVLFHFHQMPYAQIAETLDVPINTIRTYLHRARRKLRHLMADAVTLEDGQWRIASPKK